MSSEKRDPGYVGYIGVYTNQIGGGYNRSLKGSLLTNQYHGRTLVFEHVEVFR